jgi:hypothetical protein
VQTITFYSYKGGTGRTLLVANAAKYLARLGQRVFALDLDLEAPGLHYKFRLDSTDEHPPIRNGVVDYLYAFCKTREIPTSLREYTVTLAGNEGSDGSLVLMPAGNVPSADYWRRLAQINWYDLFFSENPQGIPLFLELKERIRREFSPDFLLVDARTGITEIGGVATTVLPDQVVCLLLKNRENLEGAREVLRGIRRAARLADQQPVGIVPVLARIPGLRQHSRSHFERQLVEEVKAFLCREASDSCAPLDIGEILTLHTEEDLQLEESLRVGGKKPVDESPLLRDYLRLFSRIIPKELVEPHLDKLIQHSLKNMISEPDRVQSELEALVSFCPHPTSYIELLKYYRLRNAGATLMLKTASQYWELSGDSANPLLWEVVQQHLQSGMRIGERRRDTIPAEFIEAVWGSAGADHVDVGLMLAELFFSSSQPDKGVETIERLLGNTEPSERAVALAVQRLVDAERPEAAAAIIQRYREQLSASTAFQMAWAQFATRTRDSESGKQLLESKHFRPAKLQSEDPMAYVRLMQLVGDKEEVDASLQSSLEHALRRGHISEQLMEVGRLFAELGKEEEFKERVRKLLPEREVDRLIRHGFPFFR